MFIKFELCPKVHFRLQRHTYNWVPEPAFFPATACSCKAFLYIFPRCVCLRARGLNEWMGEDFADISPSPIFGLLLSETFPVLIAYLCQYLSQHVWDLSGVYWIVIPMIIILNYLDHVCQEEMCPRLLRLQNWKSQKKGIIGIKQNWKSRKKGCRHRRHLCRERYAENVPECASDYIANQHHHPPLISVRQHPHPPRIIAKRHHHPPLIIAKGNDHI